MKNLLTYLFAILALVACSDSGTESGGNGGGGQEIPKQPEITLSTTAADFSTDGGSNVITFTSSEAWTAEVVNTRADDWCSIEPTSGPAGSAKITVTTTANDTPDDRTASIIIKAGTTSKTINVSQKQKDALTVTSSKFEVSAEGGAITIEVKANINFDFEIDDDAEDWITHRSTRALKTLQLVFEIDKNEDTENRKANISISSGNLRETVTIYQEGNEPTIVLSDDEFTVSSSKETIAIDVKSNVDVAVEIPNDADWIKENTTRAFSTNTYYFDIAQNDNYDNRTAEIKFTNKENGIYEKVKITQLQRDAIVIADSEYTFDENGGKLDFEIKTNVEFKVSISSDAQSWIKQVDTRGLQSKTLHFDIAKNESDYAREGVVWINGDNISQKIRIKQDAYNPNTSSIPSNQIWYISNSDEIVQPYNLDGFGAKIISNIYKNGKGVITFEDDISAIGTQAFFNCNTLESITLPMGVIHIGDYAFSNCYHLTSVSIPDTVTSIGDGAFIFCHYLTDIIIPDNVESIGINAFGSCKSLNNITIPNNITRIRMQTFAYCENLQTITMSNDLSVIEDFAFAGCYRLKNVLLHNINSLGVCSFQDCHSLKEITIPESITNIGDGVFSGCRNLKAFYGKFASSDNRCVIKGNRLIAFAPSELEEYSIQDNIDYIGAYCFAGCDNLKSITIPHKVYMIGQYAFVNCSKLVNVYCMASNPPQITSDVFGKINWSAKLYVPTDSVRRYEEDYFWSTCFTNIIAL